MRQLICLRFLTLSTDQLKKRGLKNMENEQEITPLWQEEKLKSPARMALNQNQKNANLQKQIREMDRSKIRTKRKPSRFFMENEYVHGGYAATLPDSCTTIYTVLSVHCNNETQVAFPSISTIQVLSGCANRNTTIKSLSILASYGIIGILKTKGFNMVNVYAFQATRYWKPIPGWKEKMDKYRNKSQYQFVPHRSNKRPDYRGNRDDTLTNLNNNSSNNITNIKDVLMKRMQELKIPIQQSEVAIQEGSLHSVDGRAKHEDLPVITGKLREYRGITGDTTIEPIINQNHDTPYVDNTTQKQREDDNFKSAYE